MYEISLSFAIVLVVLGFVAGFINTMAGGGSNLTVPALIVLGLPTDVANGTNRVNVLLQSFTATRAFHAHGKLDSPDLKGILGITLVGGLFGALAASYLPESVLKPTLLGTMLTLAAIMAFRPNIIAVEPGAKILRLKGNRKSQLLLLLAGFYGGFVQAGVGFILIAAVAGGLRYDLVRANAMKIICTLSFTTIALFIFIARDQVEWIPGLILSIGSMAGAHFGVRVAVKIEQTTLKYFIFVMTLVACIVAFFH